MIFNLIKHAKQLLFDNSKSGLSANNTQDAIDELSGKVDSKVTDGFTAERALIAGTNGKAMVSGTTSTELYMLHGVTDYVQKQLNAKVTRGTVAELTSVKLGASDYALVYADNNDVKFRHLDSDGNVKYTAVNTIVDKLIPTTCKYVPNNDWNNATTTGFYMGSNATNAPSTGWYMGIVYAHNTGYVVQEVWAFTDGDLTHLGNKYVRQCRNGVWGNWIKEPRFSYDSTTGTLDITL